MTAHENEATDLLARAPLGAQIADRLRREILFGVIGPEDKLTQDSICARFGTSRIPVRDAVRSLLHEGLLRSTRSGIEVVPLTERDLEDIFKIEGTLHSLATRMAAERATKEDFEALDDLNDGIADALDAEDHHAVALLNAQFHRSINHMAGSARVIAALRATSVRIDSEYLERFPEHGQVALQEHRAIVKALRTRNASRASTLMLDHVAASAGLLHENLARIRAVAQEQKAAGIPELHDLTRQLLDTDPN